MSHVVKTPGGGIITLDFKVNRFIGLSGIMQLTLFNKSVVKGCEFTIALTSLGIKLHSALAPCGLPWLQMAQIGLHHNMFKEVLHKTYHFREMPSFAAGSFLWDVCMWHNLKYQILLQHYNLWFRNQKIWCSSL